MPKLEQWEIDLRKQLQNRSFNAVKAVKETWEDQLEEDIQDVDPRPQPRRRQAKSNNTLTYLATLLLLGIVTLFAYDHKTHALRDMLVARLPEPQPSAVTPPQAQPKYYDTEIKAIRTDLKRVEDDFASKTKWNNERIALMGMLLNENFLVLHNGADKSQYIFFNRDWTITGMPHQLQLSAEDKAYLQKYVKPQ